MWKYLKKISVESQYDKKPSMNNCLPQESGPLSRSVPSSAIASANEAVLKSIENAQQTRRGKYGKYSSKEKADIGRRAAEFGITATMKYYESVNSQRQLPSSSVYTWKVQYLNELAKRKRNGEELPIKDLPQKKRGRPLLLGEQLDNQVEKYLKTLRDKGGVVNTAIVMACAEGVITNHDSNLLANNGGYITITKDWAKALLSRMGFVKRRASTSAKISPQAFDELKKQFLFDAKCLIDMEEIPDSSVINWDQTGIQYVPVSSWTMEKFGMKRVEIKGLKDKRLITAVFAATKDGYFLPPQIIYKGKTNRCLPLTKFPNAWHITCTENHWANEKTTLDYINKVLLPYIERKRHELHLSTDHPALVIYDKFKAQCTDSVIKVLRDNKIHILMVPASCTDRLQPLDVSVNKAVKEFLRSKFQKWYAAQTTWEETKC